MDKIFVLRFEPHYLQKYVIYALLLSALQTCVYYCPDSFVARTDDHPAVLLQMRIALA